MAGFVWNSYMVMRDAGPFLELEQGLEAPGYSFRFVYY
jgi:hypothetical protein